KLKSRCFALALASILILQVVPITGAQQQPAQPFEQFVARIRDGLKLNDEQKANLSSIDARVPVPLPPPFLLINIPPRVRMDKAGEASSKLANRERLIAAPARSSKARLTEDQKILHLLNRITFGPRPGDIDRIRQADLD